MVILNIIYFTILRNFRDRKTLMQMIALPILMILILGTALNSQFTPATIGKSTVAFLNRDGDWGGEGFQEFLNSKEIQELLEVSPVDSYEEGVKLVEEGELTTFLYIPVDYTNNLQQGKNASIEVFSRKQKGFRATIVENIVDSYVNSANVVNAGATIGMEGTNYIRRETLVENPVSIEGKIPGAMDYYGITMLVMILMYGAFYGLHGIAEDHFDSIGARMKTTPIKPTQMYIGKVLGSVLTLLLQAVMIVLFTKGAYGVNWGNNLLLIFTICFSLAIFATGFGIMLCILSPNRRFAVNIINLVVPLFTFLGGGYAPLPNMGKVLEKAKYLSPNYIGQRALFGYIYEGTISNTTYLILILWGLTLMTMIASITLGRRQTI